MPNAYIESSWKDGGLSIQPLDLRGRALRVKAFMEMYNSSNSATRNTFRSCVANEKDLRGIKSTNQDNTMFLDWDLSSATNHGTSCLASKALRVAQSINATIGLDSNGNCTIAIGGINVSSPKEVTRSVMKSLQEKQFKELTSLGLHGHSFGNAHNNRNCNSIIGNFSHGISDKIVSFCMAARTNCLITGNLLSRRKNQSNTNNTKCPYCGLNGEGDTLAHRLNGCRSNRHRQTSRHNLVCTEIINAARKKFPDARISAGRSVKLQHGEMTVRVNGEVLLPDIVIERANRIDIIEVTVPYDGRTSYGNNEMSILKARFLEKAAKYKSLAEKVRNISKKTCVLTPLVVSSLGFTYKESMSKLAAVLGLSTVEKNSTERRISTAALIGSYHVFYKTPQPSTELSSDIEGDPSAEEP